MNADSVSINNNNKDNRNKELGLCLSGGGFRASLFHLGALRRLNELNILAQVETISSVSGGSILSAFIAQKMIDKGLTVLDFSDWEKEISKPFRLFTSVDIRTIPFFLFLGTNAIFPGLRIACLKGSYKKRLTSLEIGELPDKPNFIFCAADLTFGVNWEFSKEKIGDYRAGYLKKGKGLDWHVAYAVTASSSFPPIFGPVSVPAKPDDFKKGSYKEKDRNSLISNLKLSDGGVYDNMGIQPVSESHKCILVSNCGAPFDFVTSGNYIRRLLRYTTVITNQAAALRKKLFFSGLYKRWHEGAYWSISQRILKKSDYESSEYKGYPQELVKDVLSKMRTDLDAFTEAEKKILENHGYFAADYGLKKYHSSLIPTTGDESFNVPHPEWYNDNEKIKKALSHSHKRISLKRIFYHLGKKIKKIL
ncbi:MAG: patatin-like phospholipase family protein [Candidatus Aminicenantes bacterium]|nr:patatin-like phospholipase family protein [Candidatus Aminicenantes bacterium]